MESFQQIREGGHGDQDTVIFKDERFKDPKSLRSYLVVAIRKRL